MSDGRLLFSAGVSVAPAAVCGQFYLIYFIRRRTGDRQRFSPLVYPKRTDFFPLFVQPRTSGKTLLSLPVQ